MSKEKSVNGDELPKQDDYDHMQQRTWETHGVPVDDDECEPISMTKA